MILWRKSNKVKPKNGDFRCVVKFAWLPTFDRTVNPTHLFWLERYKVNQQKLFGRWHTKTVWIIKGDKEIPLY